MKVLETVKSWPKKKKITSAVVAFVVCLCIVAAIVTPVVFCFKQGETSEEFWSENDVFTEDYAAKTLYIGNKDFVILNFTDIQIDLPSDMNKTGEIYKTMKKAIDQAKPSLITFSGDLAWFPVTCECYEKIAKTMDSFKIPWAVSFGNHDHQGNGDLNKLGEIIQKSKYGIFEKGPRNIAGVGNYCINIKKDDKIVHTVFMMDSGDSGYHVDEDVIDYDYITEEQVKSISTNIVKEYAPDCTMDFSEYPYLDEIEEIEQDDETTKEGVKVNTSYATLDYTQIAWYKWVLKGVQKLNMEANAKLTKEEAMPESTCVFHIPTMDFYFAYKQWVNALVQEDKTTLAIMDAKSSGSRMRYNETSGCACRDTGFFAAVKEMGSTKNIICGHDHVNDFSLVYEGVRLTYGVKTGKECYWVEDGTMNGGTMLKIATDGSASLKQIYIDNYRG